LKDSLAARLDRLDTAKEVAQLGAVLGREFSYELLQAVSAFKDEDLQNALTRIAEAGLLYVRGIAPNSSYQFKHALIRDAAYESLLKANRQKHHERVAIVLEEQLAHTVVEHPELVAHHYIEADDVRRAIPYLQRAGENAARRSANLEAVNHLTKVLQLLGSVPNALQRAQQELDIQLVLGPALVADRGYGSEDVLRTYTRVIDLCRELGETPKLFAALYGLWSFYGARADYKKVRDIAEQLLNLAQRQRDHSALLLVIGPWDAVSFTSENFRRHKRSFERPSQCMTHVSMSRSRMSTDTIPQSPA